MKGIILAGGNGTRLYPITKVISKQLLPVYDKPLIYYPLSVLMWAGIRDILIISNPQSLPLFEQLLGDGTQLGIRLQYLPQAKPQGLAQSFVIGKKFIGDSSVALILGDNIFFANDLPQLLQNTVQRQKPRIFVCKVKDPCRYGIAVFDKHHKVISVEEKPRKPKSNYAVAGLYFYDAQVVQLAQQLKPSARGEYEITDLNNEYLKKGELEVVLLKRGTNWFDAGTFSSLLQAADFIQAIEERQGIKIGCIEEVAYRMGWIDKAQIFKLAEQTKTSSYGMYLKQLFHL